MQRIIIGFICTLSIVSIAVGQQSSSFNNVFEDVSIYKNQEDVYLGNLGQAKYSLLNPFIDNNSQLYPVFKSNSDSSIYTNLFTTLGAGSEGVVKIGHHQPLGKNFILDLNYYRSYSVGFYQNQIASIANFNGNLSYNNKKYKATFYTQLYSRDNELNGGINDSLFKALYEDNINGNSFPVNLDADLEKKIQVYDFTHSYSFSNNDTLKNKGFSLRQQFNYVRELFEYSDDANTFYDSTFIDSTGSNDSIKTEYLTHNLSLVYDFRNYTFYAGISNSYADYKANGAFIPSMIHSVLFGGSFKENKLLVSSTGSYTFSGFLSGNYNNRLAVSYSDTSMLFDNLSGNLFVGEYTPYLFYFLYNSNHYRWDVPLNNENILSADVSLKSTKLDLLLTAKIDNRQNHVYFDEELTPKQTSATLYQLGITKQFKFTKWLTWKPAIYYQGVSSPVNIELPALYTTNRLYTEGKLFKNNVITYKVGLDITYYSSFYAKSYNPSFDHFYVQENEKAGNYPFVDVFAEFYLKNNVAFFVKSEHVNNGLTGPGYIASPTYRQADRTIKGGVKWRLYN